MNRFYYSLVFFLVLLSLPLASSAVVGNLDITFLNSPAFANKDLNFQTTWTGGDANILYWQFDSDGNVLQSNILRETFLNDAFSDEDISDWDVISGAWTAAGGNLVQTAGGNQEISKDTGQINDWSTVGLEVTFDINAFNVAVSVLDTNQISTSDGYRLTTSSGEVKVKTVVSGAETDRLVIAGSFVVEDTMRYKFDINGLITVFQNDTIIGNITDTNFTSFRFANVDAGTNAGIKNILITDLQSEDSTVESGASQTHTFTTAGPKTIQLTVQNPDGNASTSLDLNIIGSLNITVFDENAGTAIQGATIDFNSGTYITPANGNVNIPLGDLTTGEFTISIDVNSSFPQKQFVFDLNQFSSVDLNALMLGNSFGTSRSYKIFQPDKTTAIINSMIEWRRTTPIPNGIAQRTETDASGNVTFFGQQDANYVMRITDTVAGGILRDYNGTLVTVKKPLDITNTSIEITPFDITVGGLATQTFSQVSLDTTFNIFSDTVDFYSVTIDGNTDYFSTQKLIQTRGGQPTEEFQPYLVPQTGNLQSTIFAINNSTDRQTVPNIRVQSETTISGSSVVVESKITDITGTVVFSFEIGREYTLSFFNSSGTLIFTGTYVGKSGDSELFALLQQQVVSRTPTTSPSVSIDWRPIGGNLVPDADGNVSVSQILKPFNVTIGDVNVIIASITDTNIVYSRVFSVNSSSDFNLSYEIDVNGMNIRDLLFITLNIKDDSSVTIQENQTATYTLQTVTIIDGAALIRQGLGPFASALLAIFLTMIAIGFLSLFSGPAEDNNDLGVATFFITGFFFMLGFLSFQVWSFATLFSIGLFLLGLKK